MLSGRFGGTSAAPFIEGKLYIPRLSFEARISFLVDTGADTTTLLPDDVRVNGLDVSVLLNKSECVGVGGIAVCYDEEALLVFTDDTNLYSYVITLSILHPKQEMRGMPSILGRDVLRNWGMTYDFTKGKIGFVVRRADATVSIT